MSAPDETLCSVRNLTAAEAREVLADSVAALEDNTAVLIAAAEMLSRSGRLDPLAGLSLVRVATHVQRAGDLLLGGTED